MSSNKEEKSYKEIIKECLNTIKSKINGITKKQCIIIIVFFVISLCVCINIVVAKYDKRVYPGVSIYQEDISGMNYNELREKLEVLKKEINEKEVKIKIKKNTYVLSMNDIVSNYNTDKLYEDIVNENKNKNILEKFMTIIKNKEKNYKFNIDINEDKIVRCGYIIDKENSKKPLEPKVIIDNEVVKLKEGKTGKRLDLNRLVKNILYNINNENIYREDMVINCKEINELPTIKINSLKNINHKISSYSTSYASGGGRGDNIEVAAKKIDDLLLMPGEEFSYEKALGQIDRENGYKNAPVIINGDLKDGIGGGVCQVSSTLYNTQLKSGILPTERRNHSKPVSYVPRGLDATLATGSIDYKFKNTLEYPIVINTKTSNNLLTIEFWSNEKALDGIEYEAVGYSSGKVANTYLYGYNEKGKKVYEKHIDTSVYR